MNSSQHHELRVVRGHRCLAENPPAIQTATPVTYWIGGR